MVSGPRHLQIGLPEERAPNEKSEVRKGHNYLIIAFLFLVPILVFITGLALFFMAPVTAVTSAAGPYQFEAGRFSGLVEIYSQAERVWTKVARKGPRKITGYPHDQIRTQADSDIDLEVSNVFDLRLKEFSIMELLARKRGAHGKEVRFKLLQGSLLGFPQRDLKDEALEIETPTFLAAIPRASFLIQIGHGGTTSIGVLEGEVKVYPKGVKEAVEVKALETLEIAKGQSHLSQPRRINYEEWRALTEVRDLTTVTVEKMNQQIELREKAGNFFKYVFDEGVFYNPNFSFASREFYEEPSEETVLLKIGYDVYPKGSFSGMYFKIRDLDLSKVNRLSFSLKAEAGEPLPNQVRIELKDRLSIIRSFTVRPISYEWRFYTFDFDVQKPVPASEIVFVFENSKIGTLSTNGVIYLKDLTIE